MSTKNEIKPKEPPSRATLAARLMGRDAEIQRLRELVAQGYDVVQDFSRNIQHVPLQDYARYNDFCIEARKVKEYKNG